MQPLRVFTAFSGYDSQCMALDRLAELFPGFAYELVGWSEIDRYAIQAHNAVYPRYADRNYGDISRIDWSQVPDFDLFTMSSPCQDFSSAGMQRGGAEGSGTRSSLLWECRKAILAKKPKYIVFENVKALVSAKFLPYFNKWQAELSGYGYSNFAKVLNAKDYGVPQNRERIFMVSILGDSSYYFPMAIPLDKRLKDVLERNVDERYYLSKHTVEVFEAHKNRCEAAGYGFGWLPTGGSGIATCLTSGAGRQHDNYMIVPETCDTLLGVSISPNHRLEFRGISSIKQDAAPALRATDYKCPHCAWLTSPDGIRYRIRKLTPREGFRLMDVTEDNIDKIQQCGVSASQQYKMAGNSIVVACLYHLFRKLFAEPGNESKQMTLF